MHYSTGFKNLLLMFAGLPYAFKRSGLVEGAFVMAAVAYFSMKAMLLLIDCLHKVKASPGHFTSNGGSTANLSSVNSSEEMEAFVQQKPSKPASDGDTSTLSDVITYSDVAFAAWGPMGRLVVDSSLICAQVQETSKPKYALTTLWDFEA